MRRYAALLRGINVGGRNIIRKDALMRCFERLGFRDVITYLQSGNVVFGTDDRAAALPERIERALAASFDYPACVVVRSQRELEDVVASAPRGFGARPEEYRYDVLFLKPPLTARAALKHVPRREGVDEVHPGRGVLYASRVASQASRSKLSGIVGTPIYGSVTIRNFNTTTKLLELLVRDSREPALR